MLSYQHIYHAGCIADVHKHMVLAAVLGKMAESPSPIAYMETHAGRGLYDLAAPEARKTGEAKEGILRLMAERALPPNHPYLTLIRRTRERYGKTAYPGSPLVARMLLRPQDSLLLHDLHPREFAALQRNLSGKNIRTAQEDGCKGVLRHAPVKGKRGLVLIDPSFEIKTEYAETARFLRFLHKKWPDSVLLLWYPMLKNRLFEEMAESISAEKLPGFLHHELVFADPAEVRGMFGSGMIGINFPAGLESELRLTERLFSV